MLPRIGIIAGKGLLPVVIAKKYLDQGGECYIAALKGEADLSLLKDFKYQLFTIGMVGKVIEFFQSNEVKRLIFAGGIQRPNLAFIKVDKVGRNLLLKVLKQRMLGDNSVLKVVADFFSQKGFEVISSDKIFKNQILEGDYLTKRHPTSSDLDDIELGIELLKGLSQFDVGQSTVIEDRYILGIEGAEGTDNLVTRCAFLRKKISGGILIKAMKKGQDSRMDIPTIGPDTIKNLVKYNYNGVAIEANSVIILEQELTIKLANEHKIFIVRRRC